MQTINSFIRSIQIIAVVIVILLALFSLAGLYFMKFYKSKVNEKSLDYTKFNRLDSLEYVKFDDIGDYMIVTNGKKRFVAGVTCSGCDFRDMEEEEKLQVIRGYLSFINVLDNQNIQYWQIAKDVDLEKMISDYQKQYGSLQEKQYLLTIDYEELKQASEEDGISPEDYDEFYQRLKQIQREITSLGYQTGQIEIQVQYLQSISGEKADPHLEQIYFFDWTYNPFDFSQELTETEIYDKAEKQLKNKAAAYISALRNAGIKARLLTGGELLEEMRRYTHPVSAAKFKVEDIVQSACDSIAVTSNSLREMEDKVNQSLLQKMAEDFNSWEGENVQ